MTSPTSVFLHYLGLLRTLLLRAEEAGIAGNRLHPDMAPLVQQAKSAIGFATRTCCPLAGREIVRFNDDDATVASALRELDATSRYLAAMPDDAFAAMATRTIDTVAGFAELRLPGPEFYLHYALPNFLFHYTMVYAIAREAGLPVGKADFDGYHQYPAGFSF